MGLENKLVGRWNNAPEIYYLGNIVLYIPKHYLLGHVKAIINFVVLFDMAGILLLGAETCSTSQEMNSF